LNEGKNLERMVNCGSKLTRCFLGGTIRGGTGEKMQTRIHLDRYLTNIIVIFSFQYSMDGTKIAHLLSFL